jgi:hypothetical protein
MTLGRFLLLVLVGAIAAAVLQLTWLFAVLGLAVAAVALKLWFNR